MKKSEKIIIVLIVAAIAGFAFWKWSTNKSKSDEQSDEQSNQDMDSIRYLQAHKLEPKPNIINNSTRRR